MRRNSNRKRVFISYAHKDGLEFVRRLSFALEMYMEVFWDRRLRAGKFDEKLNDEIEKSDYLIIVMTPSALREDGWCLKEIVHAQKHNKPLVPIKLHNDCGFPFIERCLETNTYGDFRNNFDEGFRRITAVMLEQPYSAWEYLANASDKDLLKYLQIGYLPALIAKEIGEWVLVNKVWQLLEEDIENGEALLYFVKPRTLRGICRHCQDLYPQIAQARDSGLMQLVKKIEEFVVKYGKPLLDISDSEHSEVGKISYSLIEDSKHLCMNNAVGKREAKSARLTQSYFEFEVAEKLRELINIHARRSRYLY